MNYWLVKSEPSVWSWDQQVAKGAKGEAWTGVRNFTARQNLVNMKKGDKAFFYHSNEGKEIVGIAEIVKEAYPDPTDKTAKFVCVDIKADKPLKTPVTMAAIKADKKLAAMALVKYSRLSVQPVTVRRVEVRLQDGRGVILILRSRSSGVSKDDASWFETRKDVLLAMLILRSPRAASRRMTPHGSRRAKMRSSP